MAKIDSIFTVDLDAAKDIEALAQQTSSAASIAFVAMAQDGQLDDVTITEHSALFAPWAADVNYAAGIIVQSDGLLYKCIQAHTSQADWTPAATPALWQKVGDPTEEWPEWVQYIGGGDLYMTGDKVSHNDKHWISTVDNNVWEPGVYGWEESE